MPHYCISRRIPTPSASDRLKSLCDLPQSNLSVLKHYRFQVLVLLLFGTTRGKCNTRSIAEFHTTTGNCPNATSWTILDCLQWTLLWFHCYRYLQSYCFPCRYCSCDFAAMPQIVRCHKRMPGSCPQAMHRRIAEHCYPNIGGAVRSMLKVERSLQAHLLICTVSRIAEDTRQLHFGRATDICQALRIPMLIPDVGSTMLS